MNTCSAKLLVLALVLPACLPRPGVAAEPAKPALDYKIDLKVVSTGFDGKTSWAQARAGTIPGDKPIVVLTMQKSLLGTSDVYFAINDIRTDDLGATWSAPKENATLGRRERIDGVVVGVADFTPKWHAATKKFLGTGTTSLSVNDQKLSDGGGQPVFSFYDAQNRTWSPWAQIPMPDEPKFFHASAGCSQRVNLPNGEILLPVYYKARGVHHYSSTILRCSFDGKEMLCLDYGDEFTLPFDPKTIPKTQSYNQQIFNSRQQGLFEPSLTVFRGKYFLTLRNRLSGYVTSGKDGQHFDPPRPWTFDDGTPLGNYNTQQHWISHSDGLFLVYTRRGANNDHVFRHRAPLLIAQVDPERLCVIRSTEKILIPEKGADLGNFDVTNVNADETWVIAAEGMHTQPTTGSPVQYGANNNVYVARIIWNRPNQALNGN